MSGPRKIESFLERACLLTIALSLLAALPALLVPPGLSAEGDALDYRIPLMKWILRHGAYPDWRWTFVDDYPLLGELLMLPFLALKTELARLVPILAYAAAAAFTGAIGAELLPAERRAEKKAFFLFAFASALGLQPLLVQSNHVMVDNIAAAFALGSLYFLLRERTGASALLMAGALATRYSIWGAAPGAVFALLILRPPGSRAKEAAWFTAVASLGALPFVARNLLLHGNPVFPLLNGFFQGAPVTAFDGWGRGQGPLALLLFPYDLFYTNSFVKEIFDTRTLSHGFYVYKVGNLFYLQLAALLLLALRFPSSLAASLRTHNPKARAVAVFALCHFAAWWAGSQQLRFLGCGLALLNLCVLLPLFTRAPKPLLAALALAPLLAVGAVQQESWRLALGRERPLRDTGYVQSARNCFERAGVGPAALVGFPNRDVTNGFFDYDFVFLSPNNLYVALPGAAPAPVPDFVYSGLDFRPREGFEPWPKNEPCLLKKAGA